MAKTCHKQFSVKVGTIMEDSPIGLDKWLAAIWLIANAKNRISSYEIHRALGVTQKSAWFLLHRIRLAMQTGTFEKLSGEGEVDETYIGGKARFMHKERREAMIKGRGSVGKVAVNHAEKNVDGNVHTCNIDNFWSLLKRGIKGTYVSVEPFHLFRYLDEQSFRFNERKGRDADRFLKVVKSVAGKRLTFKELTGDEPTSH